LTLKCHNLRGVSRGPAVRFHGSAAEDLAACGVAAFAGLVGGGVGQEGVSEGAPAGSGVGQADDGDRRFGVKVVLTRERRVGGAGVLVPPVGDAGLAEGGEGDGVAAGLGEGVAAEAEHVRPAAQGRVGGLAGHAAFGPAEGPAGVDEVFGVGACGGWRRCRSWRG